MDDIEIFKPSQVPGNEVVLGTYGSEDWVIADILRRRHLQGLQTIHHSYTWLTPTKFSLQAWVVEQAFPSFTFFDNSKVLIPTSEGVIRIYSSKGKILVDLTGSVPFVAALIQQLDKQFKRAECLIQWVYSSRGDELSVPLNYRAAIEAAYPWIQGGLTSYFDNYLDGDASVLILIGPPGTGKTTFIKNLIHRSGTNAKVAYDEKVMTDDGFFAGFIQDDCRFLVMEDADAFLSARTDGNTMMHKFLNVSDGLISAADKKLVFSTNLPSIRDIDPALMRPGRCYDIVEFRALNRKEAQAVLDEVGDTSQLPDGKDLTLAQIFSVQPSSGTTSRRSVGFV